jgi:hypothetical protein
MSTEHMFKTWCKNLITRLRTHGSVNCDPEFESIFSGNYWYMHDAFVQSLDGMIIIDSPQLWITYMIRYMLQYIKLTKFESDVLPEIINRWNLNWDVQTINVYCGWIENIVIRYMNFVNKGYKLYIESSILQTYHILF